MEKNRNFVPSFLLRTFEMLEVQNFKSINENDSLSSIVSWSENGQSFIVYNTNELAQNVLPNFFKHRNYPSFLRQLNMYNFKKTKTSQGFSQFKHKWFRKELKSLLQYIKRRNQEDFQDQVDINLKECDILEFKKEYVELKDKVNILMENACQIQKDFSYMLQQSMILQKDAQQTAQGIKQLVSSSQKKFDCLSFIIGKIVSGIENQEMQTKLTQIFNNALVIDELCGDQINQAEPCQQPKLVNNNVAIQEGQLVNRNSENENASNYIYSGFNSPYRSFEIASPYMNFMMQNNSNILSMEQRFFKQMNQFYNLQNQQQQFQMMGKQIQVPQLLNGYFSMQMSIYNYMYNLQDQVAQNSTYSINSSQSPTFSHQNSRQNQSQNANPSVQISSSDLQQI